MLSTKDPKSPRSFLNLEPILMSAIGTFKMIPFFFVDAVVAECDLSDLYVFICCRAFVCFGLFVIWDAWDAWDGSWECTWLSFVLDSLSAPFDFVRCLSRPTPSKASVPSIPSVPFSFSLTLTVSERL